VQPTVVAAAPQQQVVEGTPDNALATAVVLAHPGGAAEAPGATSLAVEAVGQSVEGALPSTSAEASLVAMGTHPALASTEQQALGAAAADLPTETVAAAPPAVTPALDDQTSPVSDLTEQLGAVLDPDASQDSTSTPASPAALTGPVAGGKLDAPALLPTGDEPQDLEAAPLQTQEASADDAVEVSPVVRNTETLAASATAESRPATAARAAVTESIRSELWEIAKRAQNLQRVEAVVSTTLGDLSVVARHTANGVAVTLTGEAAGRIDLAALQQELAGLDVSVDLSQQPRAPEWDADTIASRAPQRPQQIITSTIERSTSKLDVLA
jgi:hypothetical protein